MVIASLKIENVNGSRKIHFAKGSIVLRNERVSRICITILKYIKKFAQKDTMKYYEKTIKIPWKYYKKNTVYKHYKNSMTSFSKGEQFEQTGYLTIELDYSFRYIFIFIFVFVYSIINCNFRDRMWKFCSCRRWFDTNNNIYLVIYTAFRNLL